MRMSTKREGRKHTQDNDEDVDQENWTDWGPLRCYVNIYFDTKVLFM